MENRLRKLTEEINELRKKDHVQRVQTALEIGTRLIEARELVGPGEWTRWRREQVRLSARSAGNLVALARLHGMQPASFRHLSRIGLNKLYRIAELPERFLKRLRPHSVLKIPGTQARKSLEEMSQIGRAHV